MSACKLYLSKEAVLVTAVVDFDFDFAFSEWFGLIDSYLFEDIAAFLQR